MATTKAGNKKSTFFILFQSKMSMAMHTEVFESHILIYVRSRWVVVNHTAVTPHTHVVDCECKRINFGLGVWLVNKNM